MQELHAAVPNVRIVWDRPHGLWEIQERGRLTGQWRYVCYWADHHPVYGTPIYRELPPSAGPIRQKLSDIDMKRFLCSSRAAWKKLEQEMDEVRVVEARNRKEKWQRFAKEYGRDLAARGAGIRQTFGMGRSGGRTYGRHRLWLPRGSDVARAHSAELQRKP